MFGLDSVDAIRNKHPASLSPKLQPDGKISQLKANEMNEAAFADGYQRFLWVHQSTSGKPFYAYVTLCKHQHTGEASLFTELEAIKRNDCYFEQLTFLFFEQTSDAVMFADSHEKIQLVNGSFCAISGYSKQDVIGQRTGFMNQANTAVNFILTCGTN